MIAAASPTLGATITNRLDLVEVTGTRISIVVDPAALAADMATYDAGSGTSPSVAVCRQYVRAMFDAVRLSMVSDYGLPDPCPLSSLPPGETLP
jgi:hypothetical protein